ncbi:MAG: DUF1844 domain-containing protein [Bacteroidetes bacterium]|nr:DUF1844 domain-containing protein [Bacteroidota bacterium]
MGNNEKNKSLFYSLVLTFQATAMQQMGKLKNPLTDKIERNLEQAQMSIDILDMLETKTKGNLDEEEERFLKSVLHELKLNYVDEVSKDKKTQTNE